MLGLWRANIPSQLSVKLFSKNSNITGGRTDRRLAVTIPRSAYDTIRKKSRPITETQKLTDQLNLAHVARKKSHCLVAFSSCVATGWKSEKFRLVAVNSENNTATQIYYAN